MSKKKKRSKNTISSEANSPEIVLEKEEIQDINEGSLENVDISENHIDDSIESDDYHGEFGEIQQETRENNQVFVDDIYNPDSISETSIDETESYGSFAKEGKKKKNKDKNNGNEESFGSFVKEFNLHLKQQISKNKKALIITLSVAAIIVVVVIVCLFIPKNNNSSVSVGNTVSDSSISVNNLEVPMDPYEVDAYPAVNELISKYYVARQDNNIEELRALQKNLDEVEAAKYEVLGSHIDEYVLNNCYTKKGPFVNSYIVYATFDVKLSGYDVLAPGLQTFVVCSEDDGSLYIYSGDFEPAVADYISKVSAQDDVKELMNRVSVEYNDVLASNIEFGEYMNSFKSQIKTEIGEKIAANEVSGNSTDKVETAATSENSTSAGESFSVKTTKNVNIRKSDSENADKLDTISAGTTLLCTNEKANGWSEVIYNGQTGYIKSEFLVKPGEGDNAGIETNGSVMINETIKIRKEPSTDAGYYGVGYAGQTFEKIETLDNGWTKIVFEGNEAYIKSEFIVQ